MGSNMSQTIIPAATRRQALKSALSQALRQQGRTLPELTGDETKRSTSDLTMEQLQAALNALGINPDATVAAHVAAAQLGVATPDVDAPDAPDGEGAAELAALDTPEATPEAAPADTLPSPEEAATEALAPLGAVLAIVAPDVKAAALASVAALVEQNRVQSARIGELLKASQEQAAAMSVRSGIELVTGAGVGPVKELPAAQIFGVKTRRLMAKTLQVWNSANAPAIDPNFVFDPEALYDLTLSVRRGDKIWLYGPKGTGKTSLATQFAARTGRDFVRVAFNAHTEPQDVVGATWPAAGGGHIWKDGSLLAAIRKPGCCILLDEPTIARPGTLAMLQTTLDENYIVIGETGERVDVAPGVVWFVADNTNGTGDATGIYAGTQMQNRAFLDRFGAHIAVDYLPPAKEAQALVARSGCSPAMADILVRFATVTRQKTAGGELVDGVGFRRLVAMAGRMADGCDPERALTVSLLNCAPPEDVATLKMLAASDLDMTALAHLAAGTQPAAPVQPAAPAGGYANPRNAKAAAEFSAA